MKKKEETRKNVVHEQVNKKHKKKTIVTKDKIKKETQVPLSRIANP